MGIKGLFNFKKAGQVVKDAQQDLRRPRKDELAAKRQQKQGKK